MPVAGEQYITVNGTVASLEGHFSTGVTSIQKVGQRGCVSDSLASSGSLVGESIGAVAFKDEGLVEGSIDCNWIV
jgi:hypothetical protein